MSKEFVDTLQQCKEKLRQNSVQLEQYAKAFYLLGNDIMGDALTSIANHIRSDYQLVINAYDKDLNDFFTAFKDNIKAAFDK